MCYKYFYKSDLPLLFTGESGTGKTFSAKIAHDYSYRKNKPFVAINCGAIPESIAEVELFGSVSGAFTGATTRQGFFETANGGTIFLDEVGELSLNVQTKLLKILDSGLFTRVGSTKEIKTNVRIMCATNVDLQQKVKSGDFREDLYFRISVVPLYIKPLRERKNEIPALVNYYLLSKSKTLTGKALKEILAYKWEGNVRQLFSCLDRACVLSQDSVITEENIRNSIF
jgi:Nif-specific regulatory protein